VASAPWSVTTSAVPSTTIASWALSVVIAQRGSALRLRVFRDFARLLNQRDESCHTPHTGVMCGRPSGRRVETQ
jgi:hypothetical protein